MPVDIDHVDEMVFKKRLDEMILSLSCSFSLLWLMGQCAQGAIGEMTSYSGDLARKTCHSPQKEI